MNYVTWVEATDGGSPDRLVIFTNGESIFTGEPFIYCKNIKEV